MFLGEWFGRGHSSSVMSFMFFERDVGCGPSVSAVWWASCFGVGIDHGTSEVGGRLRIFGRSVNHGPL